MSRRCRVLTNTEHTSRAISPFRSPQLDSDQASHLIAVVRIDDEKGTNLSYICLGLHQNL